MAVVQASSFRAALQATGTETGRLIADLDWSSTALGPIEGWPQSLKTILGFLLRSPVPVVLLWGEDGVMLYNDAYSTFAGGRHPELLGSKVREGWPEVAAFNDHVMRVGLKGGTLAYKDQELTLHRHGRPEQVFMNLDYSSVPGEDGEPAGVIAVVIETSERVAAERQRAATEAALRAERDRAQGVLDNMGEAFALLDRDLRILDMNAEAMRLEARPREEVIGRTHGEAHPNADPELALLYRRALTERRTAAVEHRYVWPDGRATWVEMRAYPVNTGLAVFYRDVTERRQAEEALREREERLRLIVEGAADYAILTIGPDGRITSWSTGAAVAFGYAADEIVGEPVDVLFTPEDRAEGRPEQEIELARRDGFAPDVRWHRRKDGSRVFVNGSVRPLRDGTGNELGYLKIARDETERRRADDAARETAERYRMAVRATNDAIWDWHLATDHVLWNEALEAAYGHRPADVEPTGAWWIEHIHPDDRGRVSDSIHAAIDGAAESWTGEYRFRRADGTFADVLDRGHIIRDEAGRATRMLGAMLDLSERKRAEAELVRANALLSAVMEAVPGVVYAKDWGGRMIAANRGTAELIGKPPANFIGRTDREFLDDRAQAEAVTANDRRIMAQGRTEVLEEEVSAPDGTPLVWLSTKAPFRDAGGNVVGLVGASVDITARKRTEERLRELNETLEAQVADRTADRDRMWRLSTDLMLVARFDGTITALNPAWTSLLGWREDELAGRSFVDLVHPDDAAGTEAAARSLSQGEAVGRCENRYRARDGSYRWLSWTAVPGADLIHAVGRDVTAEKEQAAALAQAEEALRQAQKMEAVGQLTGGIAHDFNNLLTGVIGSLDMMQRRIAKGEMDRIERYATAAMTSANRAAALTHRLLAFSRRQPLDPKRVNANRLATGMEELLRRTIGEAVRLEIVTAGGLWQTLCDPHQLESAILNLAINARDAMPEGGKLTVETCNAHLDNAYAARSRDVRPGQYVCICVTDTGTGMGPDVIAKAFDPFFTTKPIGQGTGLGLSMIYGFARQSEGYAKIYSELGKGTTVKLYLPRYYGEADGDEGTEAKLGDAHRAEHGEVVLVVEDETAVRDLVVDVLQELGYRAVEAADGPSGLKLLQSDMRIDLLVTDVGLPGLNGRQLADAARQHRPDLKVLFMTGYAENATIANGFLEPGMQMMTKPFAIEALATRIRDMIEDSDRS